VILLNKYKVDILLYKQYSVFCANQKFQLKRSIYYLYKFILKLCITVENILKLKKILNYYYYLFIIILLLLFCKMFNKQFKRTDYG